MMRVLAWKELREHWPIWLAMLALSATLAVTIQLTMGSTPPGYAADYIPPWAIIVGMMVSIHGLVCGGMMLAGEKEGATLVFLDLLAGVRWPLWLGKLAAGLVLSVAQGLAVALVLQFVDLSPGSVTRSMWWTLLPALALEAFAWGVFFSAWRKSVMAATVLGAILVCIAWVPGASIEWRNQALLWVLRGMVALAALSASGLIFCTPDWRRRPTLARFVPLPCGLPWRGWREQLWLQARQGRWLLLALVPGVVIGGIFLRGGGLGLWMLATLVLGAVCGHMVFATEQAGDAYRFLGQQRLPIGEIWWSKTVFWFLIAAVATLGMLVCGLATNAQVEFTKHRHMYTKEWGPVFPLPEVEQLISIRRETVALLWLTYGFAFGLFFGQIIRKNAVALVLSLLVGGFATFWWVPPLVNGGLALWLVLPAPFGLLVASRAVSWPWVNGRLGERTPVVTMAGAAVFLVAWTAAVLWHRSVDTPVVQTPFDFEAFTASLPTPEKNEAGRLIREALRELRELRATLKPPSVPQPQPAAPPPAPGVPGGPEAMAAPMQPRQEVNIGDILEKGWPHDPAVDQWLDALFQGTWVARLNEAAALPPGVVYPPRSLTLVGLPPDIGEGYSMGAFLVARAWQQRQRGKLDQAAKTLTLALNLSRHLRNAAPMDLYRGGQACEEFVVQALDRWLQKGPWPTDFLHDMLAELDQHEKSLPPIEDSLKAGYVVVYGGLGQVLEQPWADWHGHTPSLFARDLIRWARRFPWEAEREQRQIQEIVAKGLQDIAIPPWERLPPAIDKAEYSSSFALLSPAALAFRNRVEINPYVLKSWHAQSLARIRAARLQIALVLFQTKHAMPAAALTDLVPEFFKELPRDPYRNHPFGYRISVGENILGLSGEDQGDATKPPPPDGGRHVPPGVGILWSVGPDRTDNQGKIAGTDGDGKGVDWIYLVPRVSSAG